jgi:hypothetical protein
MIVEHTFKCSDDSDIYAAECLAILLDDNEQLLDKVVTREVVAKFGSMLRQQVRADV